MVSTRYWDSCPEEPVFFVYTMAVFSFLPRQQQLEAQKMRWRWKGRASGTSQAKPTDLRYLPTEISGISFAFPSAVPLTHFIVPLRFQKVAASYLESQTAAWDFGNLLSATAVKIYCPAELIHPTSHAGYKGTHSGAGVAPRGVPYRAHQSHSHVCRATKDHPMPLSHEYIVHRCIDFVPIQTSGRYVGG